MKEPVLKRILVINCKSNFGSIEMKLNFVRYFVIAQEFFIFKSSILLNICRKRECLFKYVERWWRGVSRQSYKPDHLESGVSIRVKDLNQSGEKRNPRRKMGVLFYPLTIPPTAQRKYPVITDLTSHPQQYGI